jgi:alpha-tubulin suppressor-like RCC1 family protein
MYLPQFGVLRVLAHVCCLFLIASVATAAVQIVTPPVARTVLEPGQPLELSVAATGDGPLTYRWLRRGLPIKGAEGATLRVDAPRPVDYAPYIVEVADGTGSVARAAAFVLFNPGQVEVLRLDTGTEALLPVPQPANIVGVSGDADALLVLRADGSVAAYGAGLMVDALPGDLTEVVQVVATKQWGAALRSDGTVRVWGSTSGPSPTVVNSWSEVTVLSHASGYLFGVRRGGTWVSGAVNSSQFSSYAGQTNVAQIVFAESGYDPAFLLRDGTVRMGNLTTPAPVGSAMNAVSIDAASSELAILRKDGGTLFGVSTISTDRFIRASTDAFVVNVDPLGSRQVVLVEGDGTLRLSGSLDAARGAINGLEAFYVARSVNWVRVIRDARADEAPNLLAPPTGQAINQGGNVRLDVSATGTRLHYEWFKDDVRVGTDAPTLTIAAATAATAGVYRVRVFNHLGELNPPPVRVWVNELATAPAPPALALSGTGPARQTLAVGASLSLGVTPSQPGEIDYRWSKDGRVLAGETGPALVRSITGPADAGLYAVRGTTVGGAVAVRIFRVDVPTLDPVVLVWGDGADDLSFEPPALSQAALKVAGCPENSRLGLVVQADGTLRTWGTPSAPSLTGMTGLVDVAPVNSVILSGLRSDGTGVGNSSSSTPSPGAGATDLVKIVSGGNGILAMSSDGRVFQWSAFNGNVPVDLPPAVDIAAGFLSKLALLADGTVRGWGGDGSAAEDMPANLGDVVGLAAANSRFLALRADGTVAAWGTEVDATFAPPAGLTDVVSVHATEDEFLARRANGTLVRWGVVDNGLAAVPAAATQTTRWEFARDRALALVPRSAVAAPVIVVPPAASTSVVAGSDIDLAVGATGDMVRYRWFFAGQPIAGANKARLRLMVGLDKAGDYTVRVSNPGGMVEAVATVAVTPAPTSGFAVRPAAVEIVAEGDPLTLAATPAGLPGPLSYTWRRDGARLEGIASASLSVGAAGLGDDGLYSLEVLAADGSRHVTLTRVRVLPAERDPALAVWRAGVVPAALDAPIALAAGNGFFVAVNEDGVVRAWGTGAAVSGLPVGLDDVVAVAAGEAHALALKSDGTVVAWGSNTSGEATVPPGLDGVVALAADGAHSLALRRDGTVVGWGASTTGIVSPPVGAGGFIDLAVGGSHALALRSDGGVAAWGQNGSGQTNVPADLADVVQIAAGATTSYALLVDGSVRRWGSATGLLTTPAETPVRRLAARGALVAGLRADGRFAEWSSPAAWLDYGDVGLVAVGPVDFAVYGDPLVAAAPVLVQGLQNRVGWTDGSTRFEVEVAGEDLSYVWRRDGVVVPSSGPVLAVGPINGSSFFGTYSVTVGNARGEVASSATLTSVPVPNLFTSVPPPRQIVPVGSSLTLGVVAGGVAPLEYRWFHDGRRIVGANGPELAIPSVGIAQAGLYAVGVVDATGARSVALSMVRVRGPAQIAMRISLDEGDWTAEDALGAAPYQAVALGTTGGMGLGLDGRFLVWGANMPAVEFGRDVVAFDGGDGLFAPPVVALTLAGDLVGADNRNRFSSTHRPLFAETDLVDLRSQENNSLYLRSNGSLVVSRSSFPQRVANVVSIHRGDLHYVVVDMDGRPFVFGSSIVERLNMPADLIEVKDLAVGTAHTVAVRPDGTVVAWGGGNSDGQRSVPEGLDNVVRVAAGRDFSLAWREDGSVVRWGRATAAGELAMAAPAGAGVTVGPDSAAVIFDAPGLAAPQIESSSGGGVVRPGAATTLGVTASGAELSYQWFLHGAAIDGATGAEFAIPAASAENNGTYTVRVRNPAGSVWSDPLTLRVVAPPSLPALAGVEFEVGRDGGVTVPYVGDASPVIEALELPSWASFDPEEARLTGNPPDVGPLHYTMRLQVRNAHGDSVASNYTIHAPASFEGWRQRYFDGAQRDDPETSGPEAAPRGDGVPNLLKYALGVPPREVLPADSIEPEAAARLRLVYHRPVNRVDIRYAPERSADLGDWTETGLTQEQIGEDVLTGWQSWRVRAADEATPAPARDFVRLRASVITEEAD